MIQFHAAHTQNRPRLPGTLTLAAVALLAACSAPEVTIENAWIRTPPPGMTGTAAYLVLKNGTAETVTLVGATSDLYASVTIHESRLIDGSWSMTGIQSLPIAAGAQINFAPGGLHFMMNEPQQVIERGEHTTIRLEFASGESISVAAVVQDLAP